MHYLNGYQNCQPKIKKFAKIIFFLFVLISCKPSGHFRTLKAFNLFNSLANDHLIEFHLIKSLDQNFLIK